MIYVYFAIVFYAGVFAGFILHKLLGRVRSYSGVININKFPDKTVFSLELDEDPEELAFKDEVIFKVMTVQETSEKNGDRS